MLIFTLISCRSAAPPPAGEPTPSFIRTAPDFTSVRKAPQRVSLPPPRERQVVSLFVVAEAATRAEAEILLASAVEVFRAVPAFDLREDYPRIVDAAEVEPVQPPAPAPDAPSEAPAPDASGDPPAPAPGGFLVVAGACVHTSSDTDPREMLAAFFPNSRVVEASWPVSGDAHDCPQVGYVEEVSDWEHYSASAISAGRLTIVGVDQHTATSSETYDFDWTAYAVLRDEAGRVLAIEPLSAAGLGEMAGVVAVASDPPIIEVNATSQQQPCPSDGTDIVVTSTAWTVRAVGGEIEVVEGKSEETVFDCPEDPWPEL